MALRGLLLTLGLAMLLTPVFAAERTFNFTVVERMVMEYGQNCAPFGQHCEPNYRAYLRDGSMYYRNSSSNSGKLGIEQRVPESDVSSVLVVDGFYRSVMTVNGQVPGPAIEVDEGDTIIVNMYNALNNAAVTLHWHGMFQRGTPWMDGVSAVTQCGVLPSTSFTYRFKAEPAGTHSWHAHHGVERPEGLFGALIVHPKQPHQGGPRCDRTVHNLLLSTWQHEDTQSLFIQRDGPGWFPKGPQAAPWAYTRDFTFKLEDELPEEGRYGSALINGRGRTQSLNGDGAASVNLTTFEVLPGETHCFRVIATQEGKAMRVSIDGHRLVVTATDGNPVDPVPVRSVIVYPGETWDIAAEALDAGETSGSFWVRAQTLEVEYNNTALAVLRYPGAPEGDPTTEPSACTADARCVVLNCPFPSWPPESFSDCMGVDLLRDASPPGEEPAPSSSATVDERFLNFAFEPSINNRRFVNPAAPPLTQPDEPLLECPASCDKDPLPKEPCSCSHYQNITFNTTVQLVLTNLGLGSFGMHPAHLHGHSFHVLKVAYPKPFNDTGAVCKWSKGAPHATCNQIDDIVSAPGTGFGRASWKPGFQPELNFDRPPRKDTVVIPPGGYVVVRFKADNPGWWHFHCHMAHHLASGMGMMFNEAPEMQHLFPPPRGFPKCHDFTDTPTLAREVDDARGRWEALAGRG